MDGHYWRHLAVLRSEGVLGQFGIQVQAISLDSEVTTMLAASRTRCSFTRMSVAGASMQSAGPAAATGMQCAGIRMKSKSIYMEG